MAGWLLKTQVGKMAPFQGYKYLKEESKGPCLSANTVSADAVLESHTFDSKMMQRTPSLSTGNQVDPP